MEDPAPAPDAAPPQLLLAHAGNWTGAGTGVTVILPPPGTVGSGEVRGGAPATREFDLLHPTRLVDRVDAVVLSGGSAFGLAAADGVMRLLRERNMGFPTPHGPVPIVIGMSIFDESVATVPPDPAPSRETAEPVPPDPALSRVTAGPVPPDPALSRETARPVPSDAGRETASADLPGVGREAVFAAQPHGPAEHGAILAAPPDARAGREAALAALRGDEFRTGPIGAGAGARTGKWRGRLDPGGLGRADGRAGPARVTALAVVNAWGDVLDSSGEPLFAKDPVDQVSAQFGRANTTIAVLLTDAKLTKVDCHLLAQSGHTGFARALHPAHSRYDGDAVVALATGELPDPVDLDLLRAVATNVMAEAIRAAVAHSPTPPPS